MTRPLAAALGLALACTGTAQAFDTYQPDGRLLSIPTLQVGTFTFTNVTVTVGVVITPPDGDSAIGNVDTYSPLNGQLTVPTVNAFGNTYYNVVASVAGLVSAGSVSGADTYDPASGQLTVAQVSFDGAIYTNVVTTVGSIVSIGGGLPQDTLDTYDGAHGRLTIAAVQAGAAVYTNPVITPGQIISIGGQLPAESPLYLFTGAAAASGSDGAAPQAGLIVGSDGNLYGTTSGGGTGSGTVFRVSPTGSESVVYAFGAAGSGDAAQPYGGLVQDSDGNLYGTTLAGGANAAGAVYRISPGGTESLVYSFGATETDGIAPYGNLVLDADGNLWGTTSGGGAQGFGSVFTVTPSGTETVVYSFTGGTSDGANPYTGLTAAGGSFYGTTTAAGAYDGGTVFQITPAGGTAGTPAATFTPLYSFGNGSDVAVPYAPLLAGNDGNLYGTGYEGGQYGAGGVFEITPAGAETLLYSFSGGGNVTGSTDGASPDGGLIEDSNGNLYGTTAYGGAYDEGAVYRITPGPAGTDSTELLLYSFSGAGSGNGSLGGSLDGANPVGSLVLAADGTVYGTTSSGGNAGGGVVFALTSTLTAH